MCDYIIRYQFDTWDLSNKKIKIFAIQYEISKSIHD